MKTRALLLSLVSASTAPWASADVFEIRAGVWGWNTAYSGDVTSTDVLDLESDLGFDDENQTLIFAQLSHAIPLIPSVRLEYYDLDTNAQGTLNKTFDGVTFSGTVDTSLQLEQKDVLFYWEILDNVVSLDVGFRVKEVSGELVITQTSGGSQTSRTEFDEVLPLGYGSVGFDLPVTGLGGKVDVAGVAGFGDNRFIDAAASLYYDWKFAGVELGWRQQMLKLEDVQDIDADFTIGGPYLGVNAHF